MVEIELMSASASDVLMASFNTIKLAIMTLG